ncbi:MATE family efflux transporter [Clostridium sp. AN503]|uniref:MATE family efflux transporter n=1 Tax=Clostridium sp. AN503 TaxID=3160598 RepID=UPI00345A112E
MKSRNTQDLTTGRPITQIFLFAIPLVLGTLFQQLYSFVDTVIVGRFVGVDALAAVGTTYSLNFLILGFVQGLCVGFGILLAQSFGAHDKKELDQYFMNGTGLSAIISVVLAAVTFLLARPLLILIRTPENILDMAVVYIQVIFIGIPAAVLYNYSACALRAVGDSRHPFYFLVFSSVLNIVLDYVFIVPFGCGVAGAAWATVISQLVSGVLNSWWLLKRTGVIEWQKDVRGFSGRHVKKLCQIGIPMGLEYSVSAIGAVVMQGAINSLGSVAVAAQTAGEKIRQMFTLPMESVGMAMATYVGQNYGAKRMDRIRQGIASGLTIQYLYCIVIWFVIFLLKRPLVGLVLGETVSEIAAGAIQYLSLMSLLFFIHGSLMIMRNTLQGLGYSMQAIISGVGELVGRSLGGILAVEYFGFTGICFANPLAWGLALCYCIAAVTYYMRKHEKMGGNAVQECRM